MVIENSYKNLPKLPKCQFNLGFIFCNPNSNQLQKVINFYEKIFSKDKRFNLEIIGVNPFKYSNIQNDKKKIFYYQKLIYIF